MADVTVTLAEAVQLALFVASTPVWQAPSVALEDAVTVKDWVVLPAGKLRVYGQLPLGEVMPLAGLHITWTALSTVGASLTVTETVTVDPALGDDGLMVRKIGMI